jgi:hypothetical protein
MQSNACDLLNDVGKVHGDNLALSLQSLERSFAIVFLGSRVAVITSALIALLKRSSLPWPQVEHLRVAAKAVAEPARVSDPRFRPNQRARVSLPGSTASEPPCRRPCLSDQRKTGRQIDMASLTPPPTPSVVLPSPAVRARDDRVASRLSIQSGACYLP